MAMKDAEKLPGVPWTVNPPEMHRDDINLLQMRADEGPAVSCFLAVRPDAPAERALAPARFREDCD